MRRLAALGVAGTVGLLVAVLMRPGDARLALDAFVLFLGALALVVLVERTRSSHPLAGRSAIEEALRIAPRGPIRPSELERVEREVAIGVARAGDFHTRLRPVLRRIAGDLLAAQGVALDDSPRAPGLLGEDLWDLVRPDRERPHDPFWPGVEVERLRAAITRLEGISR